jgi:dienelactone hydrolase
LVNIGQTPIDSIRVPVSTFYRFRIEKAGYETIFGATSTYNDIDTVSRRLFKTGDMPPGMVYVDGYYDEVKDTWQKEYGFFIDKYEVTNRQYKEFLDQGGYRNRDYWKHEFIREGENLTWEEAMSEFTDKTGRPGPSTWEAGDYPEGQDDYPVGGISWYEAAAYAEYTGKVLPTGDHWDSSVGFYWTSINHLFGPKIYPLSNIFSKNPLPVGRKKGISCFGVYDMAGNAREWCFNESSAGRIISGGGWDDPGYVFEFWSQLPPFDRSPQNGFRCALYIDKEKIPATAFRFIQMGTQGERDYSLETPVPDQTFQAYKTQFLYDKTELKATIEETDRTNEDYEIEKATFNTAYGKEKMIAYLYLPRNASPPYQTLIFFPGSSALVNEDPRGYIRGYFEYVLNSGRAVMFPIYFDTYERNNNQVLTSTPEQTHQYTENLIKWVKDFSRSIDYLETRSDIDMDKLAFYGHSWGGRLEAVIPAVEERLAVNILILPGFSTNKPYPEADDINYVSRVKIPTLILSGRYDADFNLDNQVIPFYNLLGTPEADKRLCIYEAGHYVLYKYRVKEVLEWLDKYFGPPDYVQKN